MFKLEDAGFTVNEWSRSGSANTQASEPRPWTTTAPGTAGFDAAKLATLREWLGQDDANLHSVLVIRDGSIAFESYGAGQDERLGELLGDIDFGPATLHDLRSVTKSVLGAVVGIAPPRRHGERVSDGADVE